MRASRERPRDAVNVRGQTDWIGVDVGKATCVWPKCYNLAWDGRGLPICGDHARQVHYVLDERPKRDPERDRVAQLEATVRLQQARIDKLTGPPEPPKPKRQAPTDGTVYFIRCGGFIKIGWTSDLAKRMRAYQPDTVLLATMPGTRKDENQLHKRFAHLRSHGREWFPIAPQITEYIDVLVRKHGEPEPVVFAARPVSVRRGVVSGR